MTSERELAFQTHLKRSENYFNAIRDNGDLPWFEDAERRAEVADQLGFIDVSDIDLRRALFMERYQ